MFQMIYVVLIEFADFAADISNMLAYFVNTFVHFSKWLVHPFLETFDCMQERLPLPIDSLCQLCQIPTVLFASSFEVCQYPYELPPKCKQCDSQ